MGLPEFTSNPAVARNLGNPKQAVILMLLRNSCRPEPQAAIAWLKDPTKAYQRLTTQYSVSADLQRDSLYREFHALQYGGFSSSIADFNAVFNSLVARLGLIGV